MSREWSVESKHTSDEICPVYLVCGHGGKFRCGVVIVDREVTRGDVAI